MRALHRVLLDQPLREKMKERSYRQAAKFSWEKSVHRIMDVYRETLTRDGNVESAERATTDNKTTTGVA